MKGNMTKKEAKQLKSLKEQLYEANEDFDRASIIFHEVIDCHNPQLVMSARSHLSLCASKAEHLKQLIRAMERPTKPNRSTKPVAVSKKRS